MDESQKHAEEQNQTHEYTLYSQFYFYSTPKKVKLIYMTKNKTVVAQGMH